MFVDACTWCLLTMSFSLLACFCSKSDERYTIGRVRQLFWKHNDISFNDLLLSWWGHFPDLDQDHNVSSHYLNKSLLNIHEHLHIPVHPGRVLKVKPTPVGTRKVGMVRVGRKTDFRFDQINTCSLPSSLLSSDSPALFTLELVGRPQDVTKGTSCLEVEEAFSLNGEQISKPKFI